MGCSVNGTARSGPLLMLPSGLRMVTVPCARVTQGPGGVALLPLLL